MAESSPNTGIIPASLSSVFAVLGIFTFGIVFIPIAFVLGIIGTIFSVKNKNKTGMGLSVLAWVLVIIGFLLSPVLRVYIGL